MSSSPQGSRKRQRNDRTTCDHPASQRARLHARSQLADIFVEWIKREGGYIHPDLTIKEERGQGLCMFSEARIPAGSTLLMLPTALTLTTESAISHPVIGSCLREITKFGQNFAGETKDDEELRRACVYCLLLYESALGSQSLFEPYINLLPSHEELWHCVPTCDKPVAKSSSAEVDPDETWRRELLSGTRIGSKLVPSFRSALDRIYADVVSPLAHQLAQDHNQNIQDVCSHFSREKLTWAAAIFWSRAVLIPAEHSTSQNRREALTPLVDMLNHRPGYLSQLEIATKDHIVSLIGHTSPEGAEGLAVTNAPHLTYSSGRSIKGGEQIYLNYGARSNEELLAYFGFTLSGNEGDIVFVNDHLVYRDAVPTSLLDHARSKCAAGCKQVPVQDIYNTPLPSDMQSTAAWFADFLRNEALHTGKTPSVDFALIGSVCGSAKDEQAALNLVSTQILDQIEFYRVLLCKTEMLKKQLSGGDAKQRTHDPSWRYNLVTNVAEYAGGSLRVLQSAQSMIEQLQGALKP